MQKQILEYIDKYLSPHLCEKDTVHTRKGYSTQTALISMLEKLELSIAKKRVLQGP